MSGPIRICALLGRFEEATVRDTAAALLPHLRARGLAVLIQHPVAGVSFGDLATAVGDDELVAKAELAIVIGGDGSLLYAARLVAASGIPMLGIKAGKQDLQRFIYWNMFKCYWNDTMDWDANVITNFDWYHPLHAHRHTPEEVRGWCAAEGLAIEHFDEQESGISVRAKKAP